MVVEDRRAVGVQEISQDDKLSRTSSVLADGVVENVSQVWRAGPLEVWISAWADGLQRVSVYLRREEVPGLEEWRQWVEGFCRSRVEFNFEMTPALDQFLVELVDVIADVRRAAGTVQLELEGLEEEDDVHSADL